MKTKTIKYIKKFNKNKELNNGKLQEKPKKNLSIIFKIIICFILILLYSIRISIIEKGKICICTLGKKENRYIKEYVEHYKKYSVDKIYLYDNNDINGERFEEVIGDHINSGFVELLNWRGRKYQLMNIMKDCYKKNNIYYNWLMFYELDEFINLNNYTNIKSFLNQKKFEGCQIIYLNLVCHTDNNQLYYINKPLAERFPHTVPQSRFAGKNLEIKSIIRGNISNMIIKSMHTINPEFINCNGYGNKNKYIVNYSTEPDYYNYFIDHYYSKSTEEFIDKLNRGDSYSTTTYYYLLRFEKYFNQSLFNKEKIEMVEKGTGLDLSKYKKMISN